MGVSQILLEDGRSPQLATYLDCFCSLGNLRDHFRQMGIAQLLCSIWLPHHFEGLGRPGKLT
jgi:hypothetical protein